MALAYVWLALTLVGLVFAAGVTWEAHRDMVAVRIMEQHPDSWEYVAARSLYVGQIVRCAELAAMLIAGVAAAVNFRGYGLVRGGLLVLAALITLNTYLASRDGRAIAARLQEDLE